MTPLKIPRMEWFRRNLSTLGRIGALILGFIGLTIQLILFPLLHLPVDATACTISGGLLLGGSTAVIAGLREHD